LPCIYSPKKSQSTANRALKSALPALSTTLSARLIMEASLKEVLEDCKYYTTLWQLRMLSRARVWYMDSWPLNFMKQKSGTLGNLMVILCQDADTKVIIPCFFGLFPKQGDLPMKEIYARYFKVIKAKTGELMDPREIVVEYDLQVREAIRQVFPNAALIGAFIHRVRYFWTLCKNIKSALLGVKTAAVSNYINYLVAFFATISVLPKDRLLSEWRQVPNRIDMSTFQETLDVIHREFISQSGVYHGELSYAHLITDPVFCMSTAALEGYHYRVKQLIKTYNVSHQDMLVDKVLSSEEKHFCSKVGEITQERSSPPDLPEKFFFERSMGPLPISTMLADIVALVETIPPHELAQALVEQNDTLRLPQRKIITSLCCFEEYKRSLVFNSSLSEVILDSYRERKKRYREEKARVKQEEEEEPVAESPTNGAEEV